MEMNIRDRQTVIVVIFSPFCCKISSFVNNAFRKFKFHFVLGILVLLCSMLSILKRLYKKTVSFSCKMHSLLLLLLYMYE